VSNCEQAHPEKAFILATGVESGPGFCRFPGLDSIEAERPSGESRFPFPVRDFLRNLSLAGTPPGVVPKPRFTIGDDPALDQPSARKSGERRRHGVSSRQQAANEKTLGWEQASGGGKLLRFPKSAVIINQAVRTSVMRHKREKRTAR